MKPELILPGGDLERVKIAFQYGADAVYVGMNKHSLRKAEVRFDVPEIGEAIKYAHSLGKRLFVTFNIFAHNEHLADIEKDMAKIAKFEPDAFIMADLGVINLAKKVAPNVPIHVSTQANSVNIEDVKFWKEYGAKRVVLARELTLVEIAEIHKAVPDIELEAFVHGSMCISYSGRCLLSSYMTGRNSNLGDCAQPCRWNYNVYLEEKMRPGELFPAEESENGTNIMSSKDIALATELDKLLASGIMGLKVEGRNKSEYYLASIGYIYRTALDAIAAGKYDDKLKKELEGELQKINHRGYSTGFIYGDAKKGETYDGRSPVRDWEYVGQFIDDKGQIIVKNKISVGDKVEVLTPKKIFNDEITAIIDVDDIVQEINPGRKDQQATIKLKRKYPANTFIRTKVR
jgi:putative protease